MEYIYDFFMAHGFVLELTICAALFVFALKRKKMFVLKAVASVIVLFLLSIVCGFIPTGIAFINIVKYVVLFAALFAMIMLCFEASAWLALFCIIGACATQHGGYKLGEFLQYLTDGHVSQPVYILMYILGVALGCALSYIFFARKLYKTESAFFENKQVILLGVTLVLSVTLFQNVFASNMGEIKLEMYLVYAAYDIICCVFTLGMQFGMFRSGKLEQEYKFMGHLLHAQKQQFEASKENIELINIKSHDLKKQISMLGGRLTEGELSELKRAVSIYDSAVKTGNEVLDVILAEKSLLCERAGITLACIADGEKLGFMTASDIYSLFGNAIDNAVEAVQKLEDPQKRVISVNVKETGGMLSCHFENYYSGPISFSERLPVTTKDDKRYHGFGLKSIRLITDKYNGYFSLKTEGEIFNLNILLPVQGGPDAARQWRI